MRKSVRLSFGYETENAEGVVLAIMRGERIAEAPRRRVAVTSTRRRFMRIGRPDGRHRHIFSLTTSRGARHEKKAGDLHVHLDG